MLHGDNTVSVSPLCSGTPVREIDVIMTTTRVSEALHSRWSFGNRGAASTQAVDSREERVIVTYPALMGLLSSSRHF